MYMCQYIFQSCPTGTKKIYGTLSFLQVSEIESIKSDHINLREDFLDTKCRQMCENLIFTGINEVQLVQGEQENCERTLINFLAEHMQIYEQIQFDRVHRLGRYRRNQVRPRPIIAKFHEYRAKEMVKMRAPDTLKHTNYGVREQYPDEYERRKKVLYPKMKSAKANPDNKVRLVKDTLYINNEKFICGENNIPVKVAYQNANSGQNFSALPKEAYSEDPLPHPHSRTHEDHPRPYPRTHKDHPQPKAHPPPAPIQGHTRRSDIPPTPPYPTPTPIQGYA